MKIKLRHVVTMYKDQEGPALVLNFWCHDQMRNSPKLNQRARKHVARAGNIHGHGDALDDTNAFNLVAFGANKEDIKQKSLGAIRLLRHAESVVVEICTYISDPTAYLQEGWYKAEVMMEISPKQLGI